MQFTAEHRQIEDTVVKFCDKEINPFVAEWEAIGQFPAHEVFKKLGKLGLLGLKYPEEFGGAGLDFSYSMLMAEALGQCNCGGVPMAIGVQTDMATPALARFGSDELRKEFLTPTIAGDRVACLGVSEPGGGSDVAAAKTSAKSDGGDYLINGTKMWITSGLHAYGHGHTAAVALAQGLGHDHAVGKVQARAAVFLGVLQAQQTQVAEFL